MVWRGIAVTLGMPILLVDLFQSTPKSLSRKIQMVYSMGRFQEMASSSKKVMPHWSWIKTIRTLVEHSSKTEHFGPRVVAYSAPDRSRSKAKMLFF